MTIDLTDCFATKGSAKQSLRIVETIRAKHVL